MAEFFDDYRPFDGINIKIQEAVEAAQRQSAQRTDDALATEILRRAEHEYLTDPIMYARAEVAAQVLALDLCRRRGMELDADDLGLARHAAMIALVMAKMDPNTLIPTEKIR